MKKAPTPKQKQTPDLTRLDEVELNPRYQHLLALTLASSLGSPEWRARKLSESRELMALSQLSGRYRIDWLDLGFDLRAIFTLFAPVPCLPDPLASLQVAPSARIGFVYTEHASRWPTPGTGFAQVLDPAHLWLPNAFPDSQVLCLGTTLPASVRAVEVVHIIFRALTLQSVQMDLLDASAVANRDSALWWQVNNDKLPLTREGFVRCEEFQP